jgi:HSP20 family molecular chaperone IbpA
LPLRTIKEKEATDMTEAVREMEKKDGTPAQGPEKHGRARRRHAPRVDVIERKDDIVLLADMPGVDGRAVDITIEKDVLTIRGRAVSEAGEGSGLTRREYGVGDYERAFTLPGDIDRERIEAAMKNGVLRLVLPRAEVARPRRIKIK